MVRLERIADTRNHTGEGSLWHPDRRRLYWVDIPAGQIDALDYDRETGDIADKRTFFEVAADDGVPDGMTVDADDHVWSARWMGGRVVRYAPTGAPVSEIGLPARKVSSVTLGDGEYVTIDVTTALTDGDRPTEGDGAGGAFRATGLGIEGVPEFRSRIA